MIEPKSVLGVAVVVAIQFAAGQSRGQTAATRTATPAPISRQVDFPIVVRFSEDLLSLLISPQVNSTAPVDRVVLGTRTSGTAWLESVLHLDLKPQDRGVGVVLCLDGTCLVRTVGRNGPAIIHTIANTQFSARKIVAVDADHGIGDAEVSITANTWVQTPCIESTLPRLRGRIVRRVACRRAQQAEPQVMAIARTNAETRIAQAFDDAVKQLVARYNQDLDLLRPVFQRLRQENPDSSLVFSTTEDYLHMAIGRADAEHGPQLPDHAFDTSPLQVWLHRSILADGKSTAEQHLAKIRRFRSGLEQQLIEQFRSRDAVMDLVRSVPIILGTAGDWLVIGLPSPDEPAESNGE